MRYSRVGSSTFRSPFDWDPAYEIEQLRRALDRLAERAAGPGAFAPRVGLYDTGAAFVARIELPGVAAGEVEVRVEARSLTVSGRHDAASPDGAACLLSERSAGRFTRTIALPESVDPEQARATLKRGVLEILLPKQAAPETKSVLLMVGGEGRAQG